MKRKHFISFLVFFFCCLVCFMPVKAAASLKAPKLGMVKSLEAGSVYAEWKNVPGADGYEIHFSKQKNFQSVKKLITARKSCKVTSLETGSKYYVRMRGYTKSGRGTKYSAWSAVSTVITLPRTPVLTSAVSKKTGTLTATFQKVKGIAAYQIQTARNKSFTSGKKTIKTARNSVTVSKLLPEVHYYVRVRSVKKVGKVTVYSAWSRVRSVVTKKKSGIYAKKPDEPSNLDVRQSKNGITVSWSAVENAVRYEIMSAADAGFQKNVKTKVAYGYNKPTVTFEQDINSGDCLYYKVRVYAEDEYGNRTWSDWSPAEAITVKAAYSYKLYLLNQYPIYGSDNAIAYIKTDNPDAASFAVEWKNGGGCSSTNDYKDIQYTGETVPDSSFFLRPAEGGYVFHFSSGQEEAASMTVEVFEKLGEEHKLSTGVSLTVHTQDINEAYNKWIDSLIREHTNASMSFWDKMDAVQNYLRNNFHYPSVQDGHYLSLVAETGSIWDTKLLNSATSPAALSRVAQKLGCMDVKGMDGYLHAMIRVTWKGETREYMACPHPQEFDQSKVTYIQLP